MPMTHRIVGMLVCTFVGILAAIVPAALVALCGAPTWGWLAVGLLIWDRTYDRTWDEWKGHVKDIP